ncbi:uncharacterized protein LOC122296876 [Carya illinoinensis]|uniref:uncharacterized protein LOC122296876 n=1 Tax=Carya illinoinensis TaxID=32201 RepID=UPI001C71ECB5|nr:uncharacterized protein LOC122296876 [Carya illinoinensis]
MFCTCWGSGRYGSFSSIRAWLRATSYGDHFRDVCSWERRDSFRSGRHNPPSEGSGSGGIAMTGKVDVTITGGLDAHVEMVAEGGKKLGTIAEEVQMPEVISAATPIIPTVTMITNGPEKVVLLDGSDQAVQGDGPDQVPIVYKPDRVVPVFGPIQASQADVPVKGVQVERNDQVVQVDGPVQAVRSLLEKDSTRSSTEKKERSDGCLLEKESNWSNSVKKERPDGCLSKKWKRLSFISCSSSSEQEAAKVLYLPNKRKALRIDGG